MSLTGDFLDLPSRDAKPRGKGLTHVIDCGLSLPEVEGLLHLAGDMIDVVKLGWGTSYVTGQLNRKIEVYQSSGVPVVVGGTLGEIALVQGQFERFTQWLADLGLSYLEISNGATEVDRKYKLDLIESYSQQFTVFSEVGSKDPDALVAPFRWVKQIEEELAAGAERVILEARESGTAGVYRPDGEIRMGLVEEIEHHLDTNQLIFEAPQKSQQAWLINRLGPEVNLGNIAGRDVIGLETLRLGLRADTIKPASALIT